MTVGEVPEIVDVRGHVLHSIYVEQQNSKLATNALLAFLIICGSTEVKSVVRNNFPYDSCLFKSYGTASVKQYLLRPH